jgi:carbamoyl-phosphate synthase large subunit
VSPPAVRTPVRAPGVSSAGPPAAHPAILLTGAGKRYDIVSCFAALTKTVVADPSPLAPAQHAAHVRAAVPSMSDPDYVPALQALCEQHGVGAVLPLTDLDIEILARAAEEGRLPALVPSAAVARATYDKYETHLLLERHSLPSPPTILPQANLDALDYPVMIKPCCGSGARSIYIAHDPTQARFFIDYVQQAPIVERPKRLPAPERVMVQRAMGGDEFSIDCLGNRDGRCLNAIPRTMLESRGGESIKGEVVHDEELIELGRRVVETLRVSGPATIQVFRDPDIGLGITDVNTRFGGAFPAPIYAALPGRTYPELIVRMAGGERVDPHVGEFHAGMTFTRYYWQLELNGELAPTGRDIVLGGPPVPR